MSKLILACCKLYISESRNRASLESIEQVVKQFQGTAIVNRFEDCVYNRVGYTVVSTLPKQMSIDSYPLKGAVTAMVKAAFDAIDFESHSGSHPRLGVVDHVCFHPLMHTTLDKVASVAKSVAADIGSTLTVPVFLYGAAHEERRTLDSIRRDLGYFKPNMSGSLWSGGLSSNHLPLKPDEGPPQASKRKGVLVIGASGWVDNYNIPVYSTDIAAVRRIAKRVSGRGGGLHSVQAMALAHGDGVIELACNLLDPCEVGGKDVQHEVESIAAQEGMEVGKGYFTDLPQEKIIENYLKLDL